MTEIDNDYFQLPNVPKYTQSISTILIIEAFNT